MHYFDHTTDNRIKFFYFIRSLLLSKSPILAKSWCASLLFDFFSSSLVSPTPAPPKHPCTYTYTVGYRYTQVPRKQHQTTTNNAAGKDAGETVVLVKDPNMQPLEGS